MTPDDKNDDQTSSIVINESPTITFNDSSGTTNSEQHVDYEVTQRSDDKRDHFKAVLTGAIKETVEISRQYREKVSGAKTSAKKKYYTKKLRKNNQQLADMLVRLEQLNKNNDSKDADEE